MDRECEEGEMEKKLRRSFLMGNYCNRAGPSTPPPTWRLGPSSAVVETKEFLANSAEVSVRKLCADLWETEQFRQRIEMRRCRRRDSDVESSSGGPLHDHQTPSRGSLRKQIAATLESPEVRRVQRNVDLSQPNTPSSCSNRSYEVAVRKPEFSQSCSSMVNSASYGLGSSTKLLKVLNRIWSLEEQNTANMSLVKALKAELDECRAEIKEVQLRETHSNKQTRKNKEEEELKDVFRLMKKELDNEREVRKKSESIHRKLTRELCEAKHCLTKALKDLETERNQRLCNEDDDDNVTFLRVKEKRRSQSSKGSDLRAKPEDLESRHQRACLKKLEEELEKRTRRDNKLEIKRFISSEGDKIYPESSLRNVDDLRSLEKSRTLRDKLKEARVESRRLRSLKPESSPVQD